jgi:AhpD family alkylhydroperoxidase
MKPDSHKKIDDIIRLRKKGHTFYTRKSRVYRAFSEMEKQTYSDSSLKKEEKELIAIGISVVLNCESCMEWHISQALAAGVKEEEILEAIEVAIEMSGGPGTVAARFAMSVLDYYKK